MTNLQTNYTLTVANLSDSELNFSDGTMIYSDHEHDCCEDHYLDFSDLDIEDFNGLLFDLTKDDFFKRVEDFGIELLPLNGHPIRIPGYGYNNGYYGANIDLVVADSGGKPIKRYDVSECQVIDG